MWKFSEADNIHPLQVKQHEFREDFRKTAPFMFNSQNVYEKLDKVEKIDIDLILYFHFFCQ